MKTNPVLIFFYLFLSVNFHFEDIDWRIRLKQLLNIGLVSNETNEDVHMYIEEFFLVDVVTLLYMDEVNNIGRMLVYIHS